MMFVLNYFLTTHKYACNDEGAQRANAFSL